MGRGSLLAHILLCLSLWQLVHGAWPYVSCPPSGIPFCRGETWLGVTPLESPSRCRPHRAQRAPVPHGMRNHPESWRQQAQRAVAILPLGLPGSHRRCLLPNPVSGRGALLFTAPLRNVGEGFWKKSACFLPSFQGCPVQGRSLWQGHVCRPGYRARQRSGPGFSPTCAAAFCATPSSCVPQFPLLYPHFPSEVPRAACCKE